MNLSEFLNQFENKKSCIENADRCPFVKDNKLTWMPRIVPFPNNPRLMLISRDPTIDFSHLYQYVTSRESNLDTNDKRQMLFIGAIPYQLILRIIRFSNKYKLNIVKNWNTLFKLLEVTYWSHLHKCPTKNGEGFSTHCANGWLLKEIKVAQNEGIKYIISLGKGTENWLNKKGNRNWLITNGLYNNIIWFPHPSGRSRSWDDGKYKNEIEKNIRRLLKLLNSFI